MPVLVLPKDIIYMSIFRFMVATLALTATCAMAGNEPWTSGAPQGTTAAHQQMAAQARKVHAQVGANGFGLNPYSVEWNGNKSRFEGSPLSNVSGSTLKQAITGRYHIYQSPGQEKWSARYYGVNGVAYFCRAAGRSKHREDKKHWGISPSEFGLYGIQFWGLSKNKPTGKYIYSWPFVVDASTGEVADYNFHRRRWKLQPGWIQSEYAPAFAKHCPKLPRVNAASNQTGDTLQELARGAHPVKIQPSFANSSRNPLTAGMYYHFNPPRP
jgi:hypothetical protein